MRLDAWMVENGLAPTRSKAQMLIREGSVTCNGAIASKTGMQVDADDEIVITNVSVLRYVSRGGLKLEEAIQAFGIDVEGKHVLDIGSSTGGFTDCALQHGAASVLAVDVGTDVMHERLAADPRVDLRENTDFRAMEAFDLAGIDLVVCDVSFISLIPIVETLSRCEVHAPMVLLVKPQFECGPDVARRFKGIIGSRDEHVRILNDVIAAIHAFGYRLEHIKHSPIRGGDGNIEYVTLFSSGMPSDFSATDIVSDAFETLGNRRLR